MGLSEWEKGLCREAGSDGVLDHGQGAEGTTRLARHSGIAIRHGFRGHDPPLPSLRTKQQIVTTLKQGRDDAQEMLAFGGAVKQEFLDGMVITEDQVYIRALAVDFFISLLNTVEAWADRTLEEIESWDDLSPDGKNERAIEDLPVTCTHAGIDQEDAGSTSQPTPPAPSGGILGVPAMSRIRLRRGRRRSCADRGRER